VVQNCLVEFACINHVVHPQVDYQPTSESSPRHSTFNTTIALNRTIRPVKFSANFPCANLREQMEALRTAMGLLVNLQRELNVNVTSTLAPIVMSSQAA
jgi:hypothetical protein